MCRECSLPGITSKTIGAMDENDSRNFLPPVDPFSGCLHSSHPAAAVTEGENEKEEAERANCHGVMTQAAAETTNSKGGQKPAAEEFSSEVTSAARAAAAAQDHPSAAMTTMAYRRVYDTFKQVIDKERGVFLKVVPPYWKTLQTDVKMRWRGRQLLSVLTEEFRSRPVEYYTKMLETGEYFFINGAACTASTILRNGDRLAHRTLETEFALPAEPVLIFHEDANVLAAFKPSGMPVHPQGRYTEGSLLSILKRFYFRCTTQYLHPINRLDRVTAGVVVFAKSALYARMLTTALSSAVKLYVAEVQGDFRTCIESVRKYQHEPPSLPPRHDAQSDLKDETPPESTTCGSGQPSCGSGQPSCGSVQPSKRAERNPLICCSDDETDVVADVLPPPTAAEEEDSSSSSAVRSQLLLESVIASTKETDGCCETQCTGVTGSSKRARKKELKYLAKRERQLKRSRSQQPQLEQQQTILYQEDVVVGAAEEEYCNDGEEFLTLQEATRRGIFQVVPFPGCNLCGVGDDASVETSSPTSEGTTAAIPCQETRREAAQDSRVHSGGGKTCCCGDWMHVSARLQTLNRLIGRQLAVAWNEKRGKTASTFFRHLQYNAETNTSLVACVPRTGRTHQIRKHLQCLGTYSVVNDSLYGERRRREEAIETSDTKDSDPQAGNVDLAACDTERGEDRVVPKKERTSTERKVLASFRLEELRSVIGATTPDACAGDEPCTGAENQILDGNVDQENEANTLSKFFQDASTILGSQVSQAGDFVEIPYIIEEPWEIHLCSVAYGFMLEAIREESKAVPRSVKKKCRQQLPAHGAEDSLHGVSENVCDAEPSPSNGSRAPTTYSPSSPDVSQPNDGCVFKEWVSIACPSSIWPGWAKPVADVINNSVWPLLAQYGQGGRSQWRML